LARHCEPGEAIYGRFPNPNVVPDESVNTAKSLHLPTSAVEARSPSAQPDANHNDPVMIKPSFVIPAKARESGNPGAARV
jgi:hypothetical protein